MSLAAFGYVMEAILVVAGVSILVGIAVDIARNGFLGDKQDRP